MDYLKLAYTAAYNKYEEELSKFFDWEEGITYEGWSEFNKNKKRFIEDQRIKFLEAMNIDPMTGEPMKYGKEC